MWIWPVEGARRRWEVERERESVVMVSLKKKNGRKR